LAHFTFTNGDATEVKITTLKIKRLGVSGDTTLSKVYLYDGTTRLTDEAVVSEGIVSWNNTAGVITIPAGSSKTIAVKSNILSATSGQIVGAGINAAADIVSGASAVNGTFPINGNLMSIATATLASIQFAASGSTTPSQNTSLEPQEDFTMFQNSVVIGTRSADLRRITFRNIGSVTATDVTNFRLYIDGVQVGSAVAQADANGYITFDLSDSPKRLTTGTRVFKVVGDVIGGSTRTFMITLRKAADIDAIDTQYSANISATSGGATSFSVVEAGQQTIATGSLTISKATDSPTGNLVKGASQAVLAKYTLKAYGESIKVETMRIVVDVSTAGVGYLRSGGLFVDGLQVGSTANLNDLGETTPYTEYSLGSSLVIVPGTPKTL